MALKCLLFGPVQKKSFPTPDINQLHKPPLLPPKCCAPPSSSTPSKCSPKQPLSDFLPLLDQCLQKWYINLMLKYVTC